MGFSAVADGELLQEFHTITGEQNRIVGALQVCHSKEDEFLPSLVSTSGCSLAKGKELGIFQVSRYARVQP
jgi:hypothetical protein